MSEGFAAVEPVLKRCRGRVVSVMALGFKGEHEAAIVAYPVPRKGWTRPDVAVLVVRLDELEDVEW